MAFKKLKQEVIVVDDWKERVMLKISDGLGLHVQNAEDFFHQREILPQCEKNIDGMWCQERGDHLPEKFLRKSGIYDRGVSNQLFFNTFLQKIDVDLLQGVARQAEASRKEEGQAEPSTKEEGQAEASTKEENKEVVIGETIFDSDLRNENDKEKQDTIVSALEVPLANFAHLDNLGADPTKKNAQKKSRGNHGKIHWFGQDEFQLEGLSGTCYEKLDYKESKNDEKVKKHLEMGSVVTATDGIHKEQYVVMALVHSGTHYDAKCAIFNEELKNLLKGETLEDGKKLRLWSIRCPHVEPTGAFVEEASIDNIKSCLREKFGNLVAKEEMEKLLETSSIAKRTRSKDRRRTNAKSDSGEKKPKKKPQKRKKRKKVEEQKRENSEGEHSHGDVEGILDTNVKQEGLPCFIGGLKEEVGTGVIAEVELLFRKRDLKQKDDEILEAQLELLRTKQENQKLMQQIQELNNKMKK